jgi:hypothetical protein
MSNGSNQMGPCRARAVLGTNSVRPAFYRGTFLMTKDQLMPILIWIAAVACMWEIAGAGIHLRPGDESPAETEPRLARPARRPPAIS